MIGKQYRAHKDKTIDLFNEYVKERGDINDGVDIDILSKRVESLEKGKFTLAVAGEVKAGKSTFINALLGREILREVYRAYLPICQILKSETSFLKVIHADGKKEIIIENFDSKNLDELDLKLNEIVSIGDKYRCIPTTLLDNYIINSDSRLLFDDALMKQVEQQLGEDISEIKHLIEQYVNERTKDKIPVKIELGYPFSLGFEELSIIEAPGVNLSSGVQNISLRYFEEANAILFVQPIKPIESKSFKNFVNSVISNRSKETLFLILTHAGVHSNEEVDRLHEEAGRLYKNIIPVDRILVVDSLAQLILSDLENGISQEEIEESSEQKEDFLAKFEKKAKKEGTNLNFQLRKYSRFEKMFSAIDQFSMQAPKLQLQEILEQIKSGYEE